VSATSKERAEALRARARAEELWLVASASYEEAMAAAD